MLSLVAYDSNLQLYYVVFPVAKGINVSFFKINCQSYNMTSWICFWDVSETMNTSNW